MRRVAAICVLVLALAPIPARAEQRFGCSGLSPVKTSCTFDFVSRGGNIELDHSVSPAVAVRLTIDAKDDAGSFAGLDCRYGLTGGTACSSWFVGSASRSNIPVVVTATVTPATVAVPFGPSRALPAYAGAWTVTAIDR